MNTLLKTPRGCSIFFLCEIALKVISPTLVIPLGAWSFANSSSTSPQFHLALILRRARFWIGREAWLRRVQQNRPRI
ncbi:MAG: hypothetical protein UZ07_CHB004001102 [Chlorobi bacterium OLB7]|nr:MAG: hypothetical protein UZ07_CHB004001102 [Chlorobi bacterium OLB7]